MNPFIAEAANTGSLMRETATMCVPSVEITFTDAKIVGREVLDVFEKVSNFECNSIQRWVTEQFKGTAAANSLQVGARCTLMQLVYNPRLFGVIPMGSGWRFFKAQGVAFAKYRTEIVMQPVEMTDLVSGIHLTVFHQDGYVTTRDPDGPDFCQYKPVLDKIVRRFREQIGCDTIVK